MALSRTSARRVVYSSITSFDKATLYMNGLTYDQIVATSLPYRSGLLGRFVWWLGHDRTRAPRARLRLLAAAAKRIAARRRPPPVRASPHPAQPVEGTGGELKLAPESFAIVLVSPE